MAYYLSKFLTRLPEETKSAEELLVALIAVKFCSWRCKSPYFLLRIEVYELGQSNPRVNSLQTWQNYLELRKTAKGNVASNKETFFSALCAPLHRSLDGFNNATSPFRRLSRKFVTHGDRRLKFRLYIERS